MGKFVDSPGFRKFIQGDAVINMINGKLTRFKHALEKYGGVIDDATGKRVKPRALVMIAKDLVCPIFAHTPTALRPIHLYGEAGPIVIDDTVGGIVDCTGEFDEDTLVEAIIRYNKFLTSTESAIIGYIMMV